MEPEIEHKYVLLIQDYISGEIDGLEFETQTKELLSRYPIKTSPRQYELLIKSFLDRDISVNTFIRLYLSSVKNQEAIMEDNISFIIQGLFAEITVYSPLWTENDEKESNDKITEKTLRREAHDAYKRLSALRNENSD